MRGIFLSKKLIVVIICLIIAMLTSKKDNTCLGEAESRLISKMLESEKAIEVFAMDGGEIAT